MVNLQETVDRIMVKDLVTIAPSDTMADVADVFDRKHIHHIPVVEHGKLVGLLSKTDFMFFRHHVTDSQEKMNELQRLKSQTVSGVMNRNLSTLHPSDTLEHAVNIFKQNYFHALPISDNGKLVGILTTMDIIKYLTNNTNE